MAEEEATTNNTSYPVHHETTTAAAASSSRKRERSSASAAAVDAATDRVQQRFEQFEPKRQKQLLGKCYRILQAEFPNVWSQLIGNDQDPHPLVVRDFMQRNYPNIPIHQSINDNCQELISLLFLMRHGLL